VSQNASSSYSPNCIDTLIGAGMRIVGDVSCTGVLRVQGDILGNISCDGGPNGALVVDSAGSVTGKVSATHIAVRGRIDGPLLSSQVIEIHSGASVVGDIAFKELAIHSGGVVEGTLRPSLPALEDGIPGKQPEPSAGKPLVAKTAVEPGRPGTVPEYLRRIRKPGLALVIAVALFWIGREQLGDRAATDTAPLRAAASLQESSAPKTAGPENSVPRSEPRTVVEAPPPRLAATPEEPPTAPAAPSAADDGNFVTVKGANANRPPGVFLLVTTEPTVLYRKKRSDTGDGARIAVGAGERVSVSVGDNELIRVARGPNAVIFYQGKKVPSDLIENSAWISFVPR
jgi:cytoskeletal protein CcmA (bactofilin family)